MSTREDAAAVDAPPGPPEGAREEQFLAHLRRAGELVAARRLPEAELEILKARELFADDLRALKLLALVRFRLGRLAEAREVYRRALEVAPEDAAVRLNLGLVALKLEWYEEAAAELESATRLRPEDGRAWSYLGYAYARAGAVPKAAAAFRRAGQPEVAAEIERARQSPPEDEAPPAAPAAPSAPARAATATEFALARLLPSDGALASAAAAGDVVRFPVAHEAHVRERAVLAAAAGLRFEPAHRRKRGRLVDEPLGGGAGRFLRCAGAGPVYLTPAPAGRQLVALTLDQDVLYLAEDRVVAFDGDVVWEWGRVPWDGTALLQFRGSGRVVLEAGADEVVALRVPETEPLAVPRARLLGWLGRVVAQSVRAAGPSAAPCIACEGEGVLLLSRHGDPAQPVHQPPQPGDDGARPPDPGRALLHR